MALSTANHWLSTLEASGLIELLEPWFLEPNQVHREESQALPR